MFLARDQSIFTVFSYGESRGEVRFSKKKHRIMSYRNRVFSRFHDFGGPRSATGYMQATRGKRRKCLEFHIEQPCVKIFAFFRLLIFAVSSSIEKVRFLRGRRLKTRFLIR